MNFSFTDISLIGFFKKVTTIKIRSVFTMSKGFVFQFASEKICTKTVRYLQGQDNKLYDFSEA